MWKISLIVTFVSTIKKNFAICPPRSICAVKLTCCIAFGSVLVGMHHFQMIKQKVFLLPEKMVQLSNLNISFMSVMSLLIDIYSS